MTGCACVWVTVTVEVGLFWDWQPLAAVTVRVYTVVVVGDAFGVQLNALDRPVPGDQEQLAPPAPVNGVRVPEEIAALPEAEAVAVVLQTTAAGALRNLLV